MKFKIPKLLTTDKKIQKSVYIPDHLSLRGIYVPQMAHNTIHGDAMRKY